MRKYSSKVKGFVELTQEEVSRVTNNREALEKARPMQKWVLLMQASDTEDMPRWMEDHIEFDHGGKASCAELQNKYDSKKFKRSQKP
jgi:hypothetical protein